jgi:hypothetical protein
MAWLGAAVLPMRAVAQAGAGTDVIVGRVTTPDGSPLDNAAVAATSLATGLVRTVTTGVDGRFILVFADGGGRYTVHVRRLGFAPAVVALERRAEADRIAANVSLTPVAATLQQVTVTGRQAGGDSLGLAAGTGRSLSQTLVERLPLIDPGDLAAIASLAPGVVAIAATDTTAAAFSVGGQRPTQNHVTLDGLTFRPASVPRDAIRATKVATSTYDVSKGQFSGGEIESSTRSGTNTTEAALTFDGQDEALQAGAAPTASFSREYSLDRLSGSVAGPIARDRLFAIASFEVSRRTNPIAYLLTADPLTDQRIGIAPDSLRRLLQLVSGYGLPLDPSNVPADQTRDRGSVLGRIDYLANDANHLSLRADWNGGSDDGTRINSRGLATNAGEGGSQGGGVLASLTTQAGAFTNDVRLTGQIDYRRASGFFALPRARVLVSSPAPDGLVSTVETSVGGNDEFPWSTQAQLLEAGDEVAWLSPGGGHRVKAGALLDHGMSRTDSTEEKTGVFIFNSLADYAANTPASFERVLAAGPRNSSRDGVALYAGDAWQPRPGLELDGGARLEGSRYGDAPPPNPAATAAFGIHTDRFPSEVHLSPRLGFTYSSTGDQAGGARLTLHGGIGEFRGTIPPFLFANAAQATGLASGQSLLSCTGPGVPTPNWASYLADTATIPRMCAGGPSAAALPSVVVFAPGVQAPRVWRASLGASHRLVGPVALSVDAFYIRGVSQLGVPDRNLNTTPQFLLANEGHRPVYASPASIDPTTGSTSITASRLDPTLGTVSEVRSFLQSETRQLIVAVSSETRGGVSLQASYTYTAARDQSLGFDGESADGITAGNPNLPVWDRSDQERRHQLLATIVVPMSASIELSTVARLVSGVPFTPTVGTDINGDGQRNDQAFVFNPASTSDTAVAHGMGRLLVNGSPSARLCLPSHLGTIAARNSCTGPWVPGLDLRLNVKPGGPLRHQLTLSVTALNTLVGVDELLHGTAHLQGWGQDATIDRRLLFVTGFDPTTQSFRYQVNQHFGAASGALNPFRIPFVLAIQARLSLRGNSPARHGP